MEGDKETVSLRDTLEENYDAIEAESKTTESEGATTEEPVKQSAGRDESGRFAKTTEAEPTVEASAGESAETDGAVTEEILSAPRSFNSQEKEMFNSLAPDAKKTLLRLEDSAYKAISRKMGELGVKERKYREIDDAVAEYEGAWAKAGVSPGRVLANYLAWEKGFHADPKGTIQELLSQKDMTLDDLVSNSEQESPEVERLSRRIQDLEGHLSQREQGAIAEEHQILNDGIEQYRSETGQDGKPLRPYFDAVYDHMTALAQTYRGRNPQATHREILDAAYRDACELHPQVREKLLEQRFAERESRRLQEANQKVQKARLAGSSLQGTPNGSSMVSTNSGTLREQLNRRYDELSS